MKEENTRKEITNAVKETPSIFNRADGGIFRWNPQSKDFPSGMSLIVGRPGTGKCLLLNRLRTDALLEGRNLKDCKNNVEISEGEKKASVVMGHSESDDESTGWGHTAEEKFLSR